MVCLKKYYIITKIFSPHRLLLEEATYSSDSYSLKTFEHGFELAAMLKLNITPRDPALTLGETNFPP
jgi:hypothetical protein